MKKFCLIVFCISLFSGYCKSQTANYSGGYGYFFTGPGWVTPNDLIDHLNSPAVFGSSFHWHSTGYTTGAEGYAELNRLLIGGGGFGLFVPDMSADSGTVRFDLAGGYFKVGYVIHQTQRYFLSVHGGFGGGVMYTGIENNSRTTPIFFSSSRPVFPLGSNDYFHGYLFYDVGLGNKLIATKVDPNNRKSGGFMLGLDVGTLIGAPVDTWRDETGAVNGIPSPGTIFSPYLRITIGGGGFKNNDMPK